jgi:hypothetical protein
VTQYPKVVQVAFEAAIDSGVPIPKGYELPYKLVEFSTLGKNYHDFHWENGHYPQSEWVGIAGNFVYTVFCGGERFGRFSLDKNYMKDFCNSMNVRHFRLMSLSKDPRNPLFI